jgi:hypothetical protein
MKRKMPFLLLVSALASGCAIPRGAEPRMDVSSPPTESVVPAAPSAERLPDMKEAVKILVDSIQSDASFLAARERIRSAKGSTPVLQIGNIENISGDRVAQRLESARRRLEIALRKTGLFEIADDVASVESIADSLTESIVRNTDFGLKDSAALQHVGEHASADCQLYGAYRKFRDGGRDVRELSFQIVDLATGKQIWSDIVEVDEE